jgi:hypothetical protein
VSTVAQIAPDRGAPAPGLPPARLQRLIDEAASFHVLLTPGRTGSVSPGRGGGRVRGIECVEELRRIQMRLDTPSAGVMRGTNVVGPPVGDAYIRWLFVPWRHAARPGGTVDPVPLDRSRSQRFVIEDLAFSFVTGDAFRCFGAGRTFPMPGGRLLAGAVGDVVEGAGSFRQALGNVTLAGDITPDGAFRGHVMVRIVDFDRRLRAADVPPVERGGREDGVTYLTWIAQKGQGADQENGFSIGPSGVPRGLNIPVELKRVTADFAVDGGFRARRLGLHDVIGREIGFGKESRERTGEMGTALIPYQFEGVSRYTFWDRDRRAVGTLTANVLEGRSIRLQIPGDPTAPGLRFGYFGPIVAGTGCFSGVEGMLYGTAGSVFAPPPFPHVISNLYVARLHDPAGRWRSEVAS